MTILVSNSNFITLGAKKHVRDTDSNINIFDNHGLLRTQPQPSWLSVLTRRENFLSHIMARTCFFIMIQWWCLFCTWSTLLVRFYSAWSFRNNPHVVPLEQNIPNPNFRPYSLALRAKRSRRYTFFSLSLDRTHDLSYWETITQSIRPNTSI